MPAKTADTELDHVRIGARGADRKLAIDPVIIDVGDVIGITDWFLITSGRNTRQVRAIVDEIEREITLECGRKPLRVEGRDSLEWVLMDYGDFVVHVFEADTRTLYDLERLWSDRPRVDTGLTSPQAGATDI